MNDGELGDDEALRQALVGLQREIKARVELERERDPLTTLGNLRATQRAFDEAMSKGRFCFGAFLEVDYFKSINDQFGYEPANALLKRIGETLKEHSTAYFGITSAYRAHGDEFHLLGVCDSLNPSQIEQLEALLERSRSKIAEITVPGHAGLRCTVSVGWTTSESIDDEAVNFRVFSKRLEDAVAAAKARKRNCVVRYDPSMSKQPTFTLRMQCDACGAKLAFDVNHSNNRAAEDAYCCNCGHRTTTRQWRVDADLRRSFWGDRCKRLFRVASTRIAQGLPTLGETTEPAPHIIPPHKFRVVSTRIAQGLPTLGGSPNPGRWQPLCHWWQPLCH